MHDAYHYDKTLEAPNEEEIKKTYKFSLGADI